MKIKGVIKNLKFFLKIVSDNRKIYIGISLELLRAMWGQLSSSIYFFSRSTGPF